MRRYSIADLGNHQIIQRMHLKTKNNQKDLTQLKPFAAPLFLKFDTAKIITSGLVSHYYYSDLNDRKGVRAFAMPLHSPPIEVVFLCIHSPLGLTNGRKSVFRMGTYLGTSPYSFKHIYTYTN